MAKKKVKGGELDHDQIVFITNKVKELGSVEAVIKYYDTPCFVTDYAIQLAKAFYSDNKPKRFKLKRRD